MTFPLTESLGLKIHTMTHFEDKFIKASDLEAILEKAQRVYGCKDKTTGLWGMYEQPAANDTHSALLINIQPIQRKVKRKEIEAAIPNIIEYSEGRTKERVVSLDKVQEMTSILGRILEHGVEE